MIEEKMAMNQAETFEWLLEENKSLTAERDKLQAFKDWTHSFLDYHGVPHHPPGTHGEHGCRIGDRMDWLMAKLDAATKRTESLIDGIKHANNMLLDLWVSLGEEGQLAKEAQAINHHLSGTITDDHGRAYMTELDAANKRVAELESGLADIADIDDASEAIALEQSNRVAQLEADNAALRADLESLNALLREIGYGQGEIDADMPELFRRIIVERGSLRAEVERLREQLRPYKCGCPVVFDGFCEKHCMPRPESGEGNSGMG